MNRYKLFALIASAMFIVSCSTITTEIPRSPEKPIFVERTIYTSEVWLGIVGQSAEGGVKVTDIYVNSPAGQAGIKTGDIIVESDGNRISDIESLLSELIRKRPGDDIKVRVTRLNETIEEIAPDSQISDSRTKEEFIKKYRKFKDDGKPGDKLAFVVKKSIDAKELSIKLSASPERFHLIAPPKPPVEPTPEIKDGKKSGWMGISMSPVQGLANMGMAKEQGGVKINMVSPSSPAEKGGLKKGDVVIEYDNNTFSGDKSKYQEAIAEHIKSVGSGGVITLNILRDADEVDLMLNGQKEAVESDKVMDVINNLKIGGLITAGITKNIMRLELKVTLGIRMAGVEKQDVEPESNDQIHPELVDYTMAIETLVQQIISHTGIADKYDDLLQRYSEDQKNADEFRLRDMRYMHRDPFKIPVICDDLTEALKDSVSHNDVQTMMDTVVSRLNEVPVFFEAELKTGISLPEHGAQLLRLLEKADELRRQAFAGLTEGDILFIKDNMYGLTDRWIHDSNFGDPEHNERDKKLIQLCGHVDYRSLFAAGRLLCGVLTSEYLDSLKSDIEREGGDKEGILYSQDTLFGRIIIGGRGDDSYQERAAIIIDIGGNDFYANQQGGSFYETGQPDQPFGIIIDFSGNDRYSSFRYGCQGAGFMGVGILYDGSGDDIYIAQGWAQGSGLLGVGILVDADGEDSYKGQEYVQGAGLFGIGLLIDRACQDDYADQVQDEEMADSESGDTEEDVNYGLGLFDDSYCPDGLDEVINGARFRKIFADDSYQANQYSQGFAGPKSFGLLIDMDGNDNYLAGTKHPNGYPDNPGTFNGWSQGCGTGMRAYADPSMSRSGGIGVLIDLAGDDYYEAGTFSQGGGYFFGWGMLVDSGSGDDVYLGTRYAQGFAAHSAIGYFMDEGGDDRYKTLCGVNAGLSWDLSCVVFIDKSGNDVYDAGGFSRGATAHNGFCLFMDLGGRDIYHDSVAGAGGNDYHGGSSLSVFLDFGHESDEYPNRRDNNIEVRPEYSIFIDTDIEIEDLIRNDYYKEILRNRIMSKEDN